MNETNAPRITLKRDMPRLMLQSDLPNVVYTVAARL